MITLRPYQERARGEVLAAFSRGARRICLTMPTGAGKTITGRAISEGEDALWLVHRTELVDQVTAFGGRAATVQSLLGGERPPATLLIADEAHHVGSDAAPAWHAVAQHYPRILGLTATPERGDGTPLGDLFDHLIVGATYSELLAAGALVKARVYRPPTEISGLAQDPLKAWLQHAVGGRRGFAFFSRVETAEDFAILLRGRAATITATTPADARREAIRRFKAGDLSCLSNVYCLTEGVDVPEASICLLARGCEHAGAYLQMVGRILRAATGKTDAVLVDLSGASWRHGMPHEDRTYSLEGKAIRAKVEPVTTCPQCGCTYESSRGPCPECGYQRPPEPPRIRVWDLPLSEAAELAVAPKDRRIVDWKQKWARASDDELRIEYRRLLSLAVSRGYKPGWASYQMKLRMGRWPHRGITGGSR